MTQDTTYNPNLEFFKKCCNKWIQFFGLKNWEIQFICEDSAKDEKACVYIDAESRICTFNIEQKWIFEDKPTEKDIDHAAFHEVAHALLGKLISLSFERFIKEREIESAEHEVIRILENAILPKHGVKMKKSLDKPE